MLALLGWNPGTEQEIFTLDELAKVFSFDRVIKSGARFNPEKAKWFNEQYLRMRTPEQLAKEFIPILQNSEAQCPAVSDLKFITQVCGLIKERAHFVGDFSGICKCLFKAPDNYEEKDVKVKFANRKSKQQWRKMLEIHQSCQSRRLSVGRKKFRRY